MKTNPITATQKKRLLAFMKHYMWTAARWEHSSLTMIGDNGEPWEIREITPGSVQRIEWDILEMSFRSYKTNPFLWSGKLKQFPDAKTIDESNP